jgi:hypothetical protein
MDARTFAERCSGARKLDDERFRMDCPINPEHTLVARNAGDRLVIMCFEHCANGAVLDALNLAEADLKIPPSDSGMGTAGTETPGETLSVNGTSSNGVRPQLRALAPIDIWKFRVAKVVEADCEQAHELTYRNTSQEALIDSATQNALAIIQEAGLLPPEETDLELEVRHIAEGVLQGYLDKYEAGTSPTIISVDPIMQAVDNALTNIVKNDCIEFETTDKYLSRVREARGRTKILVENIARSHSLGMLVGRAWQGKTTLAANLCRAMHLGEKFLGNQCYRSRVGYMALERNGEDVAALFEKWGIQDQVQFVDSVPMGDPREMARALAFAVRRYELEAVTVDHLIGMIRMLDGNDYVGVSMALAPFSAVTKITGVYLQLLHHQPKGISTGTEINVMGSEAFRAATDTLMEASKIGNNYFFRAQMRGSADIERVRVKVSDDGLVGGDESVEGVKAEVLEALQGFDKEVSKDALVDKYPALTTFHAKTILRALKELYDAGQIGRDKKRGRQVYWVLGGIVDAEKPKQGNIEFDPAKS